MKTKRPRRNMARPFAFVSGGGRSELLACGNSIDIAKRQADIFEFAC